MPFMKTKHFNIIDAVKEKEAEIIQIRRYITPNTGAAT